MKITQLIDLQQQIASRNTKKSLIDDGVIDKAKAKIAFYLSMGDIQGIKEFEVIELKDDICTKHANICNIYLIGLKCSCQIKDGLFSVFKDDVRLFTYDLDAKTKLYQKGIDEDAADELVAFAENFNTILSNYNAWIAKIK